MLPKIINFFTATLKNKSKPNLIENKGAYHWSREKEELLAELSRSPTTRARDTLCIVESRTSDSDFDIFNIDGILKSQQEFLDRIKIALGLTPINFHNIVLPVIRNYAAYVYLLPLTKNDSHDKPGGLFRYGIEVGFYAAQSAGGVMFPQINFDGSKSEVGSKWILATFISGLISEVYIPFVNMTIKNQSGVKWVFTDNESLYEWLLNNKSRSYFIEWGDDNYSSDLTNESAISIILDKIITPSTYEFLSTKNLEVINCMRAAILKSYYGGKKNPISDIVVSCSRHVKESDLKFQHKLPSLKPRAY